MTRTFPQGFLWGTSTAAYQVEGAANHGGRTPSIWDTLARVPGRVVDGSNGDVACDQYHRFGDDIALMRELGVGAYRFSVSWSRVIPELGRVNRVGLDYYDRLADALLDAGIQPVLTLYHLDLPQYLEDAGGWPNRDTAFRFGDYAGVVAGALGDRVHLWTTLNEPWCSAYLGYGNGVHAPGIRDYGASLAAAHHLNLAHGLGAQAVRSEVASARLSISLNPHVVRPATDDEADREAAALVNQVSNEIWFGPLIAGSYPPEVMEHTAHLTNWDFVKAGDCDQICQPLDVLGINYYSPMYVRHRDTPVSDHDVPHPGTESVEFLPARPPLTAMGWSQEPDGLTELLTTVARRYPGLDLLVTENGAAFEDVVSADGSVHDPQRVSYLETHLNAVADAIDEGAPVKGYIVWSLLDNFEWALGYTRRFGLFYTDYTTQARLWKDSARWYQDVVKNNRLH